MNVLLLLAVLSASAWVAVDCSPVDAPNISKTVPASASTASPLTATTGTAATSQQFEEFLKDHNIRISDPAEKAYRLGVFSSNLQNIDRLNREKKHGGATFGITQFSHLTSEEIQHTILMTVDITKLPRRNETSMPVPKASNSSQNRKKRQASLPTSFDWRTYNKVTPVKDQGSCADCYSFATVGCVESQVAISGGGLVDLSEQELTSCGPTGANGCSGADPLACLIYIEANGVHYETADPYASTSTYVPSCPLSWNSNQKVSINGIFTVTPPSQATEDGLADWLINNGPFIIGWDATDDFMAYKGGIYSEPNCPGDVNHVLLIVGYGVNANGSYWIAKNSWGNGSAANSWGDETGGYVLLQRGVNICNFTTWIWSATIGAPNLSQGNVPSPVNCYYTGASIVNGVQGPWETMSAASGCQSCPDGTAQLQTCWNGAYDVQECASGSACVQSANCVASCVGPSVTTTTAHPTSTTTAHPTSTTTTAHPTSTTTTTTASPTAPKTLTVYQNENYTGSSKTYTVTSTCSNSLASEFNDEASSLTLTSGCVELFGAASCAGGSQQYTGNTPSLGANDRTASSFRACSSLTVYDNANYTGTSYTYTITGTCNNQLASQFNDQTSSLTLTSGCVEMFGAASCAGGSKQYTANAASLTADGFDNSFSSFRACSSMSVYADVNYGGISHTFSVTGTCNNGLISNFNDQTNSLQLTGCVQLFADGSCAGTSIQLTTSVADLGIDNFDNTLSSFRACSSVSLYADPNYGGISHTFAVNNTCNSDIVSNFNDQTSSLQVTGCVQLFADSGCSGASQQFTANVANLSTVGFDNTASSLSACS